jgi:enamine deaminase RidA (YjgF/YER057c/UK114 family)
MKMRWLGTLIFSCASQMAFAATTTPVNTTPDVYIQEEMPNLYVISGFGSQDPVTGDYPGITGDPNNPTYNVKEIVRQVFTNLETALESQNMTLANVTQITVYMTRSGDYPVLQQVWGSLFFNVNAAPTVTTIFVNGLTGPNIVMMDARASRNVNNPYNKAALLN